MNDVIIGDGDLRQVNDLNCVLAFLEGQKSKMNEILGIKMKHP